MQEVKRYQKIYGQNNFIRKEYEVFLKNIISRNNLKKVSTYDLALIDIAYTIIYFGVTKNGEILVRNNFTKKYRDDFFYNLLRFIKLKPNRGNKQSFEVWHKFNSLPLKELISVFESIIKNRKNKSFQSKIEGINLLDNYKKIKFYGGHQHRLGHYYRHLFQTFKFLSIQTILTDEEKYFFAKTLRAQLSNYEQSMLFINSISEFGFSWELYPEKHNNNDLKLITTYQLIKNISGQRVLDLHCKFFYKNISFEFDKEYIK
ncbi:putative phage abortive infection protein [Elizabethkingia ursingii]|uniref:putative phage abortive infection protein n=1 Tax=Elizabethkingia ursingii TaxID=1756150 RepID=UPI00201285AB|nr:putative phage abortive infection protein [Elizabethkingia ursingii]MCL1666711.1 putative phage abortive infection protein [Elizabethkingia ursingii]